MLKYIVETFLDLVFGKPLPVLSELEQKYLLELNNTFQNTPLLDTKNASPSESVWLANSNRLRELVLTGDPRRFLRWDVVTRTMFISYARYIDLEIKYLKRLNDWSSRWRPAIRESSTGYPTRCIFYPASSANLIHHAYHLARHEERTGVRAEDLDLVFEFGGGYGSMCRLFYNLGFKGKYVLLDLPGFSALQRYYLKTLGLPVLAMPEFAESRHGILCTSDTMVVRDMIRNTYDFKKSMFIATWSISECPIALRDMIMPFVAGFNSFLIAYRDEFGEVDNSEYFSHWKGMLDNVNWHLLPIAHIPDNTYLFGKHVSKNK